MRQCVWKGPVALNDTLRPSSGRCVRASANQEVGSRQHTDRVGQHASLVDEVVRLDLSRVHIGVGSASAYVVVECQLAVGTARNTVVVEDNLGWVDTDCATPRAGLQV